MRGPALHGIGTRLSIWAACGLLPVLLAQELLGFALAFQELRVPGWLLATGGPWRLLLALSCVAIATGWLLMHCRRMSVFERPVILVGAACGNLLIAFELALLFLR